MEEQQKQMIFSFLEYLGDVKNTQFHDNESLEVAVQCLQDTFSVDLNNEEQRAKYSIKPHNFLSVFQLGLVRKDELAKIVKDQLAENVLERKFQEYIEVLKSKNYFANTLEGSQEYQDKYNKAREKFFKSYSSQPQPQPQPQPQQTANTSTTTSVDYSPSANTPIHGITPSSPPQLTPDQKAMAEDLKNQGNLKLSSGNFEEAASLYSQAINIDGTNAIYYSNRAAAYSQLGNFELAIADGKEAVSINPQYAKAHSRLGLAYFKKGEYDEAIRSYKVALELEPANIAHKQSLEAVEREKAKGVVNPSGGDPNVNFSDLLNNPVLRNLADSLSGRGNTTTNESQNPSTAPQGVPDLGNLLNNPELMNMAQSAMNQPGFAEMMNSPAMRNMAQSFLQNPEALSNLMGSLFGGGQQPPRN